MASDEARLRSSVRQLQARLADAPDESAVARAAGRSVVTVVTSAGSGSGFAVGGRAGHTQLVTNYHVVAADYVAGRRTVTVNRGPSRWTGRVVEVSPGNDLAVIELRHHLPRLAVAGSRPAVGAAVLVLGSPLGLGGTVTSGIVSAYRDDFDLDFLQFSAPISPGNSGGPVLDERGRVVGVAVAKMVTTGAEGIGFAIPASRLCIALSVC
jgi:putative serine protease PepD